MQIENIKTDKLPGPLKASEVGTEEIQQEDQTGVQMPNQFWKDMLQLILPIGINVLKTLPQLKKYPATITELENSIPVITESGGFLADKYFPITEMPINPVELGHLLALGFVAMNIYGAYSKEDRRLKDEKGTSGGTHDFGSGVIRKDSKDTSTTDGSDEGKNS